MWRSKQMHNDLTYQYLPEFLMEPLMAQAISQQEASLMLSLWLMAGKPEWLLPLTQEQAEVTNKLNLLQFFSNARPENYSQH
jgi:hypothetical protein